MKTHNCKSCAHCCAVYRKYLCGGWKNGSYYCNKTKTLTDLENSCKHWQRKQKREYGLSPERFNQAENDVKYIMEALGDL